MHSRLSIRVCPGRICVCVEARLRKKKAHVCVPLYVCLIHLNQAQCSHFLSPSTLSVAAGDKNHLRRSKMTENNGEISGASFCSPIYSARSKLALSGLTHRKLPPPFLFYLDFILPTQTFHFLTDWGTLFNSFIHLCLQAGTDVTVNKNGRALQAPLLPLSLCVQSGSREFNRGRMLWLLNGFPGSHGLEN